MKVVCVRTCSVTTFVTVTLEVSDPAARDVLCALDERIVSYFTESRNPETYRPLLNYKFGVPTIDLRLDPSREYKVHAFTVYGTLKARGGNVLQLVPGAMVAPIVNVSRLWDTGFVFGLTLLAGQMIIRPRCVALWDRVRQAVKLHANVVYWLLCTEKLMGEGGTARMRDLEDYESQMDWSL